jgi:branched-chain amino acid aminotransferase
MPPAHTYWLTPDGTLTLTDIVGPGLDAVSLRLPDGIYTTLRTYSRDRVVGLSGHLQRLIDSHNALEQPRPVDVAVIRQALRDVIALENLPEVRMRITTPFNSTDVYIGVEPFEPHPAAFYEQGIRCATSRRERATPEAKYTAFIAPSRSEKADAGSDVQELLRVNEAGEILEGFSSNFYAVIDKTLYTASEGVLAGITRTAVLALAPGSLPVVLKPINVSELPRVSEAFISSSGREVMPVRQVDDVVIGEPGPITRDLLARYRVQTVKAAEKI